LGEELKKIGTSWVPRSRKTVGMFHRGRIKRIARGKGFLKNWCLHSQGSQKAENRRKSISSGRLAENN